ncbi:MAG: SAP domain-containing protein [Clostridiales bacterium]|nr:SAP domain-containing protein [Clostridiales bacterium]
MSDRPELSIKLKSNEFLEYYYLKEELVSFCRENGLPASGGKAELTERIAYYLDTGKIKAVKPVRTQKPKIQAITRDSIIESGFVCSELHRAFFKREIGDSFSFNVAFQKWLKSNSGKTYADAIAAYKEIKSTKKPGKKDIDKQFEYNTYVRDFFCDNKGASLVDAIKCWKYKKSIKGSNKYERSDLTALDQ